MCNTAASSGAAWAFLAAVFGATTGFSSEFYRFPSAHTAHGCLLEGAVLAIAGRFEPFSTGRGRITPERVDEMLRLSCASGVTLAPLFDAAGLWREESAP